MNKPVPPEPLDPKAVYLAPSGQRCTFVPSEGEAFKAPWATLVYCMPDGTPRPPTQTALWHHSFALMPANWRMLRRVR